MASDIEAHALGIFLIMTSYNKHFLDRFQVN